MEDTDMRNIYSGLFRIEETFRISRSGFDSRPAFVHIDAHFTTCFAALVQIKLGNRYPVGKIPESLRKCSCARPDVNLYQFLYYDGMLKACGKEFNPDPEKIPQPPPDKKTAEVLIIPALLTI